MKTHTINTYSFDELSAEAQQTAINNNDDINVFSNWWEYMYEDAERIGLKITSFDICRGSYCELKFNLSALEIAAKIKHEHGETCETYKTADLFLNNYDKLVAEHSNGDGEKVTEEKQEEFEEKEEYLKDDFKRNLSGDYLKMLRDEYEYLTSSDAIKETLIANDYQFTENGQNY